ncbi:DUF1697 domain-containing protein [Mesorhizobium xinjiangense]|uniref:DUF1697 domain-containing protein n=1 Tax=Mesorhizobium xinjiangense TaxID=2678685 RepID=UPI0012ED5A73|nr:DUF1697 domain-containing protein [Mesorhizobium xinjiangense]
MSGRTVYLILFRGVGGATQLPVKRLREALEEAGFENPGTYINSGNAFLATDMPRAQMLERITRICAREFGFTKDIHVRSLDEWDKLIANNPYPDAVGAPKLLHAAVLAAAPDEARLDALRAVATDRERIAVVDRVAYLLTPDGFGRLKLAARFDKGIGVPNTARNWNTVTSLAQLARAAAST